jgi:hypothetical protein
MSLQQMGVLFCGGWLVGWTIGLAIIARTQQRAADVTSEELEVVGLTETRR